MGTVFSVVCYAGDHATAEKHVNVAFSKAEEINRIASDYHPNSEVALLSLRSIGEPMVISSMLFELLFHAHMVSSFTNHSFDPTLGHFTKLWRQSRSTGKLPDAVSLERAFARTGVEHFTLDQKTQTLTMRREGLQFDLGGIAKGYATDVMHDSLMTAGIRQVLITAGGDVRAGDAPPGKSGWAVAVKTFDKKKFQEIHSLANAAVSTSGDLHQSVEIDGVTYSHIIDPKTGLGLRKKIAATVIATEGKWSDPLATAACVLNENELDSLRKLPQVKKVILHTVP